MAAPRSSDSRATTACAPSSSRASAHRALAIAIGIAPRARASCNESRAHAARRAGDEHGLAAGDVGSREHALRGDTGAAEGGELGIGKRGLDDVRVARRDRAVLGEPAVAAVTDVVDVGETGSRVVVDAEIHHRPFPHDPAVHTVADRGDAPGDVRALDQRELEPTAPPPRRHCAGIVLGAVGAFAHPDVGVVDAARGHPHQHLAGGGGRCGHVLAVLEHLRTSVSGQQHRAHRRRHVAHRLPILACRFGGRDHARGRGLHVPRCVRIHGIRAGRAVRRVAAGEFPGCGGRDIRTGSTVAGAMNRTRDEVGNLNSISVPGRESGAPGPAPCGPGCCTVRRRRALRPRGGDENGGGRSGAGGTRFGIRSGRCPVRPLRSG